jgi:hypothetical protein
MALTALAIKKMRPKQGLYRKTDSGGLCIEVSPKGSKLWRWRYNFNGKAQMLALGKFPDVSLEQARKNRDAARDTLRTGKHPSREKQAQRLRRMAEGENTFEVIARNWMEVKGKKLNEKYHKQSLTRMEQHIFPMIGAFLGWQAPKARRVLYLDGEMPLVAMQERLARIVKDADKEPQPDYFRLVNPDMQERGFNLATDDGRGRLEPLIDEKLEPASDFPSGPYSTDKLVHRSDEAVEYQTPAHGEGLGTKETELVPNPDFSKCEVH